MIGVDSSTVVVLIALLIISIGIFFLLREFWCWYFKINELVTVTKEGNNLLREQNNWLDFFPVIYRRCSKGIRRRCQRWSVFTPLAG